MKINQILLGQLGKQLIHDMDHSIALDKRSVLPLESEYFKTNWMVLFFCLKLMICYINLFQWSLLK